MALPLVAIVSPGATFPLLLLTDRGFSSELAFPSATPLSGRPLYRALLPQELLWFPTNTHTCTPVSELSQVQLAWLPSTISHTPLCPPKSGLILRWAPKTTSPCSKS